MSEILVLDNFDSFTFNLVHYLEETGQHVAVVRNDEITVQEAAQYRNILLSPGPGLPSEAGIMNQLIRELAPTHNILGICLGHQAIAEVFGARLVNLERVFHGEASTCEIVEKDPLFEGIPLQFMAGRYHSWMVEDALPPALQVLVREQGSGAVMALRHAQYHLRGLQFHPESILTPEGKKIIRNWLKNLQFQEQFT